jgi:hypothetical protein
MSLDRQRQHDSYRPKRPVAKAKQAGDAKIERIYRPAPTLGPPV